MGQFEYLLLFVAVILGLAVSDLAISLHRLLSAGSRVRWDWLAPLAALLAFLKIIIQWWNWFGAARYAKGLTFEMFAAVSIGALFLFLMAAAALPDDAGKSAVDLRAHYAGSSRRYWLLFLGHWVLMNVVSIWAQVQLTGARLTLLSPVYLIFPVALSLAVVSNRWWHTVCLLGLIAFYGMAFFGSTLT